MDRRRQDGSGYGAKTFLVVDDQPIIRTVARAYLEKAGFIVSEAEDGRDALDRCGGAMPDAILLDRDMPNMDGGAFLAALRLRSGGKQPKVILCTASRMPDLASYAAGAGADGLVEKPFSEIGLMRGLRRVGLLGCDRTV
jgi:two-component system chemotaxis response regulator CheY